MRLRRQRQRARSGRLFALNLRCVVGQHVEDRRRPHRKDRVTAVAEAPDAVAELLVREQARTLQPRVDVEPKADNAAQRKPVRASVAEVALLVLGGGGDLDHHLGRGNVEQPQPVALEGRRQHFDGEIAKVRVHMATRGGALCQRRIVKDLALSSLDACRNLTEVASPEVWTLQQIVERMHTAKRRQLRLVVQVANGRASLRLDDLLSRNRRRRVRRCEPQ
mmetsp:Transcript_36425/g.117371  ORF Transcript_36425/g.117371 Transcript_36425/m.117371 type:complete len:221 (-) Transcript_36425:114-776(-)